MMRKIDPSQAKTETHRKRCPNGYHKDENGVCRRIEELEGEHPDLRHRTPESYERGKREHEKEQAEGKAPKMGEVLDSNSKIARDIRSAFTTSDDAGEKEKARKARQDLMEYLRNHDNVPPLTKAKSFVMKYDAEKKEYVRAERMEEGAYAFDGHTSTKNAYTTEDGNYTQERLEFHARILDSIINGYTNRKGEKVPPMSKPPEGTKPRMVVLCGGSGSGKSTITPTVKEKHGWDDFQSVDPDTIMTEFFPEWDELSKQNVLQSAYLAHDEASDIAKMVTKYLITNGYNVIVDGTFSKPKKADELFGYIEDSGIEYESSLIAIDVDEAVSVKSCQDRFVNTGRLVPESVAKASNRGAFDVSRDMSILSRFDTVDTFYRDGDNITEVATKDTKDGDIIVRNKEHWKTKKARNVENVAKARATKFKVDFSNATFSSFDTDGCTVSGFAVTAERYGMDASIYGVPIGEIGYWIDDSEFRQKLIDKYAPKYPEHSDEEYYDENGMYSEELEAKFHQEADDWEKAMDDFEASLDSVQTTVDDIRMPSVTLKCKADGYGAWDYDDSVDCKPKLHMVINVPGRGTESSWEKCEGTFYPSQDVIDFMCAYVDEEEEIEKMKKQNVKKEEGGIPQITGSKAYVVYVDGYRYDLTDGDTPLDLDGTGERGYANVEDAIRNYWRLRREGYLARDMTIYEIDRDVYSNLEYFWKHPEWMPDRSRAGGPEDYEVREIPRSDILAWHRANKGRTNKGRRENLAEMNRILRQMQDLAHRLVSLDADYDTYNTEELLEDIDNMIYWLERERDDPEMKSRDKIDPSNPESIRKGMMRKCGCGGKMEKEDESPEEPTQEAPQQTVEDDAVSDTSDEAKPVESKDEQEEDVEKSVPMLKDPGQMFKACYEYQESRKLQGLYSDEISKVCGGADPQAVIGYHMKGGAIQRIRCSDGYIYRFNGQNMRRL